MKSKVAKLAGAAMLASLLFVTAWAQDVKPAQTEPVIAEVAANAETTAAESAPADPKSPAQTHAAATVFSEAYQTRLKIHKYASFATLPLFATEFALGQSLYNNPGGNGAKKGIHGAVATGIIGLFAVNTVTGTWNLWEDRKDAGKLKLAHGVLMMASEAGFVAAAAITPHDRNRLGVLTVDPNRATHRDIALTSIGVATVGYVMMLFGHR